jgi:glycosyltransferase involved in cell wall biosynthesis
MIRVMHLITGLARGGAETMLAKLLAHLDRGLVASSVVSMIAPGELAPAIDALGVPVVSLGMGRRVPDPRGFLRLIDVLRRERPHILQTWLYHADLLGTLAARLGGARRLVWSIRCAEMDLARYSLQSRLVRHVLPRLSRFPDAVLANSEAGRRFHEKLGYRPRRWEVVPNGFDTGLFRPDAMAPAWLRGALGVPKDAVLIGMPARFDPMKDHATFIAAAGRMARRHERTRFVLIGQGMHPGNAAIAALIAASGAGPRIHLLGERSDMPRILAGLDLMTLASFGEGFPNVVGEAMSCGVPCVATDVGDCAALIGDSGAIVPRCDPDALADAWSGLLSLDREALLGLGLAGRARIARDYAMPAVARRYEAIYADLARGA